MKAKKKFYAAIILVVLIVLLLISYLFYIPPLLGERGYNIPGWIYNFFAYSYNSSRMEWLKNEGESQAGRRATAMAAWYRPDRMEELLGRNPDDLFSLGREYLSLGLNKQAVLLFRVALSPDFQPEHESLEIISYLAIIGDWPGTSRAAQELLKVYPESAEGNYWLGRALLEMDQPDQAAIHLQRSLQLQPEFIDALFQIGRLEERRGKEVEAASLYDRVVARVPDHLGAWKGLVRLLKDEGKVEKLEEARARCRELTPPVIVKRRIANKALLRGYRISEEEIATGDSIELELFLESFRPKGDLLPLEPRLISDVCPQEFIQHMVIAPMGGSGQIVPTRINLPLPFVLYPGGISVGINLITIESSEEANKNIICGDDKVDSIVRFQLIPDWVASIDRGVLIKEKFGSSARSLGKRTFLGPADELKLDINDTPVGLGLVTYLHRGRYIPQGTELGRVVVELAEGEVQSYPLLAGRDTAEVWWRYAAPERRKHRSAALFRDWDAEYMGTAFKAGEYYCLIPFSAGQMVKSITVENYTERSGLCISDLVLIFPEDTAGWPGSPEGELN